MLATFLSAFALLFTWGVAYLFAVPMAFLVQSSGVINFPIVRVFKPVAKGIHVKGLQKSCSQVF